MVELSELRLLSVQRPAMKMVVYEGKNREKLLNMDMTGTNICVTFFIPRKEIMHGELAVLQAGSDLDVTEVVTWENIEFLPDFSRQLPIFQKI